MPSPSHGSLPGQSRGCTCARVKTWTTRVTMAMFFLAGGIEYSVILPTMWDYLHGLGGNEWLYGLSLSAFSVSNLIAGPLYGFVFDMTHQTKLIVLFANLFEIGGNFMYFSATSKYMILGSRFIVGLGAGAGATLFGELARISTKKERTKVFSTFTMMRQVGLILGPAFNLFLRVLNVKIGPFTLDKFTAPGALMVVIWIVLELMFVIMFYQLPSAVENENESEDSAHTNKTSSEMEEITNKATASDSSEDLTSGEVYGQSVNSGSDDRKPDNNIAYTEPNTGETTPLLSAQYKIHSLARQALRYVMFLASQMVREEIVVLLSVLFMTMFNQTAIETMLVPMTEALMGWTERDISIFFSAAGVELVLSIVAVLILSKWIGDRWLLMTGLVLAILGFCWMMGFIGPNNHDATGIMAKFIIGSALIVFGLPFFLVTEASLYSKFLPMKVQGIGQGLHRSVFSFAAIMGPLWAGGALAFKTFYILLSVPLGLLLFVAVLVILSFKRLKEPKSTTSVLLP